MKKVLFVAPWLLLALGVTVVALCGQRLLHRHQLQSDGRATSGIVTWATTGSKSNQIHVEFRDETGRMWSKNFEVFSSQYASGQSVDVVYLPADPQIAILGPNEVGVTGTQEVVGVSVGFLAILISAGWLFAVRLDRRTDGRQREAPASSRRRQ